MIVLLGHHSFQVYAMDHTSHHTSHESCGEQICGHEMNMEICEQIQSDEMHISSEFFTVPEVSSTQKFEKRESFISLEKSENIYERIPISHQQLARSHLS